MRAAIRKPSNLISCSHCGLDELAELGGILHRKGDASFGGLREALILMASVAPRFATRTLLIPRLDTRNSTIGVSNQPAF